MAGVCFKQFSFCFSSSIVLIPVVSICCSCFSCFFSTKASFVMGAGHTQACSKARFSANDERLITTGMHDRSIFQWKVIPTGGAGDDAIPEKGGGSKGGKKKKKKSSKKR